MAAAGGAAQQQALQQARQKREVDLRNIVLDQLLGRDARNDPEAINAIKSRFSRNPQDWPRVQGTRTPRPMTPAEIEAAADRRAREELTNKLLDAKKSRDSEIAALQQVANQSEENTPYIDIYNARTRLGELAAGGGSFGELLKKALDTGIDLRPLYGTTYADAVKFKQDLGQYAGKDQSMIIPANPVGYGGQFQFDPNFGSTFYRDLATQAGKALGLSDQQILQKGTEYFADKFASGPSTKGIIGFTDFGPGLMDTLAGAAGVPAERLGELRTTALKPLYDASNQVFQGLNGAARIESQSSGFFKGIGQSIAKLGPIGTIALTAALGPAAGALAGSLGGGTALAAGLAAGGASAIPGLLQGDLEGALKSGLTGGALAGIGAGALKGVGSTVADAAGGGTLGNIVGGVAQGAATGGIGSLLTGGDLGQGLLAGAVQGGVSSGIKALADSGSSSLGTGITPPANAADILGQGGSGLTLGGGVTPPANFDVAPTVGTNLPSTTGFVNTVPGIGGLLDNVTFPTQGLNPNVTSADMGSGLGQGLQVPNSPTVPGQLGQGVTVQVPGGTLGQGGVTPTGQVTLGDPNSFINQPAPTTETANTDPKAPDQTKAAANALLKLLLGGGAAAGIAKGIGGLGGQSGNQNNPMGTNWQSSGGVAAAPLQRELGFQFVAPEYTSGLNGQPLQAPQYDVINPQANPNAGYLRAFAEGGAINQGLGAVPGMAAGRLLEGPGDGMSDDINATIEGQEPVRLADGEYVIPAQVVSALGSGSSKAGSKVLDDMVKRVYKAQTGKPKQMKPMNTNKVLPA